MQVWRGGDTESQFVVFEAVEHATISYYLSQPVSISAGSLKWKKNRQPKLLRRINIKKLHCYVPGAVQALLV